MSALSDLKAYFIKLHSEDKKIFRARIDSVQQIIQSISQVGRAPQPDMVDGILMQIQNTIHLFNTGLEEGRYVEGLRKLQAEIKQQGIVRVHQSLLAAERPEVNALTQHLKDVIQFLEDYAKERAADIKKAKAEIIRPEQEDSLLGFAKGKTIQRASLTLFKSASVGDINIPLTESKLKIARELMSALQEIVPNDETKKDIRPANLVFAAAIHLYAARDAHAQALTKYKVGSEGALGKLLRDVFDYMESRQPGALAYARQVYEQSVKEVPTPPKPKRS